VLYSANTKIKETNTKKIKEQHLHTKYVITFFHITSSCNNDYIVSQYL